MVVIEPPLSEEKENRVNVIPKPESKPLAAESSSNGIATAAYASENEFIGGGDDIDGEHQRQSLPPNDESLEAASIDDVSIQKALAEGNNAKLEGNRLVGDGHYEEALLQYEVALQVAPDMPSSGEMRAACHANRALCFLKLGKYEDTIKECTEALQLNPNYVKALRRRGEAHKKLEQFEEAIADMKKLLELDQSDVQARRTIHHLEPLAAEKRERMKQEMIEKLKEMGNSVLGLFGMSVDNFKAVQDPKTGSYSVSFQR